MADLLIKELRRPQPARSLWSLPSTGTRLTTGPRSCAHWWVSPSQWSWWG